jgi:hypothetical protein
MAGKLIKTSRRKLWSFPIEPNALQEPICIHISVSIEFSSTFRVATGVLSFIFAVQMGWRGVTLISTN